MNTMSRSTDPLTIGELAERTGVSPATLRIWEQRHGFPTPSRLDSGHRRYAESDVEAVRAIVERREAGIRLDVAISNAVDAARAAAEPRTPSVYAELRRLHPQLPVHRLRKSTLLALSWAIEDEFCAKSDRAHLFGSFQHGHYYAHAAPRWTELARVASSAFVYADFSGTPETAAGPTRVHLPDDAPMRREWTVVCDSRELPAVLTAWELPGQDDVADRDRIFESCWTIDPQAVREAARVCARVAAAAGVAEAAPVLFDLADDPAPWAADLVSISTLFNRVVAYVDRFGQDRP